MVQLDREFGRPNSLVGLYDANYHIFAATLASDPFAQHTEGLADSRRITQKNLQPPTSHLRLVVSKPLFR